MHPLPFDELAAHLKQRIELDGFDVQSFQIGPLRLNLAISTDCSPLMIDTALSANRVVPDVCDDDREVVSADLTVYVLHLSAGNQASCLKPFLHSPAQTLEMLSDPSLEQFFVRDDERQVLKVFDHKNRLGLLAIADFDCLPSWEIFSPVKEFIHLAALKKNCLLLHGASLVCPGASQEGVLLVGPGGSGKSTLTAYGVTKGMQTNGDDYVLVDLSGKLPQCWSVYRTMKLHPSSPVAQGWRPWQADPVTGKAVVLLEGVEQDGPLLKQSTLSRICGLSLVQSAKVNNPKAKSIVSHPVRHPYLHSCMSTVQQIPYRIDVTLALAKKLHESIAYSAYTVQPGIQGLQFALAALFHDQTVATEVDKS